MPFGLVAFFACLLLLWHLDYHRAAGRASAHLSLLRAGVLWGTLLVLATEILSGLKALTPRSVTILWTLLAAALLAACALASWYRRRRNEIFVPGAQNDISKPAAAAEGTVPAATLWYWGFLIVWFAALLLVALVAAPNNNDSMCYHLPRVMHWADNRSIGFFPTDVIRQNAYPPFSDWVLLHMFLMTGSDRVLNVLQWLSFAGICVAVCEIAGLFSENRHVRRLAVILAATTPLAILEATSTQNDLVVSFFFLCFLAFGLRMSASEPQAGRRLEDAVFCGFSLGLALLTKTTMFLFAGVFSLWIAVRLFRAAGRKAFAPGAVCGLLALLIISGHSLRNHHVYGHPLGPASESNSMSNQRMTPAYFASNVIRNIAMLCQNPILNLDDFLGWEVWQFHERLKISPNEHDITWPGATFTDISELRHEDWGGYPIHIALIAVALIVLPFRRRQASPLLHGFAICAVICLVLFWLIFRWQPFHSRYEMPLVLAMLPLSAAALFANWSAIAAAFAGFSICYGLQYVVDNHKRPFFGQKGIFTYSREMQYSRSDLAKFRELREIARQIKLGGYTKVGLIASYADYHYPLWPLLRSRTRRKITIYDVNVHDPSGRLWKPESAEAVVVSHSTSDTELVVEGLTYDRIWGGNHAALFARRPSEEEKPPPGGAEPAGSTRAEGAETSPAGLP